MKYDKYLFLMIFVSILACENSLRWNLPKLAVVETSEPEKISERTVQIGGNITDDGGSLITERGICYGSDPNPTTSQNKVESTESDGVFSVVIEDLTPSINYYFRAYAVTKTGIAYGNVVSFTIPSINLPSVLTIGATSITSTSAVSGGNVTNDGGSEVIARGICYSTDQNPTNSDPKLSAGSGTGTYNATIINLKPGTTYYIRAYATNVEGTAYGNQVSFSTTSLSLPVLTTNDVSSVTSSSVVTGGNISSDGGSSILERGICYSTSPNPDIEGSHTHNGSGKGSYTAQLTGLKPGTVYYLRAFASTDIGTAYGNEVSFTTVSVALPEILTLNASSVANTSAISGGNVTNDGGAEITARGLCFSTSSSPTINDNVISEGSGTGIFNTTITGLSIGTTYYVRAYATNSAGTAYGNQINFKTTSVLEVGQNYRGGIIFYLDDSRLHGLIAAPEDQSSNDKWGCSNSSISGTSTSIGTGLRNTLLIITGCLESNSAARTCLNMNLNGYSDWYLPSRDELERMYNNLKLKNIGNLKNEDYWSSSQQSNKNAWIFSFDSGKSSAKSKNSERRVRAIRSF